MVVFNVIYGLVAIYGIDFIYVGVLSFADITLRGPFSIYIYGKGAFRLERKLSRVWFSRATFSTACLHYQQVFFSDMWRSVARDCPRVLALLFFTLVRSVDNKRVSRQHVSKVQSFEHFAPSALTRILLSELNSEWVLSTRWLTALTSLLS